MINKELLKSTVEAAIEGSDLFVVEIKVSPSNDIVVELDSASGIDIDTCARITRDIEAVFDREQEDYTLEVGSAGLTSPFKVRGQYVKNIGNEVEVLTRDGRKLRGTLVAVGDSDDSFTVEIPVKTKAPGAKRPTIEMVPETFAFTDCKSVKYLIAF
ncbi:MAG: ribosome assembly cofactor RimP [Muribaculaceae bacterium]|nr:ribosome assembly cofactor RimP [Muribaculaceae bacterium]